MTAHSEVSPTDPRLSDARTPLAHAAAHVLGGADALALAQYDRDEGLPGLLIPTGRGWGPVFVASVANRGFVVRFVPSRAMAITLAAIAVNVAAGVDDPCDVGVYDASGHRLVSSGATSGLLNSTGLKTMTLAIGLSAMTVYYAAFAFGTVGGSAAQVGGASFGSLYQEQAFSGAVPNVLAMFKDAAYPLPATLAGFSALAASVACPVALRER
jgi:hypothetical protein